MKNLSAAKKCNQYFGENYHAYYARQVHRVYFGIDSIEPSEKEYSQ